MDNHFSSLYTYTERAAFAYLKINHASDTVGA